MAGLVYEWALGAVVGLRFFVCSLSLHVHGLLPLGMYCIWCTASSDLKLYYMAETGVTFPSVEFVPLKVCMLRNRDRDNTNDHSERDKSQIACWST